MYKPNAFSSHTDNTIVCGFLEKSHSSLSSKLCQGLKVMGTCLKNSLFFNFNFLSDAEVDSPIDKNEKRSILKNLTHAQLTTWLFWECPAKPHNM